MKSTIDLKELGEKLQSSRDHYLILKKSPQQQVEINQLIKVRDSNGQKRIGKVIAVDHPNEDHFVVEIMNIEIPTNMENDMTQGKKIIEMLAKISKLSIQIKDEKFRLVIENYGLYFEAQSIDMLFENLSSFIKAVCAKLNESSKNGQEKK